MNEEQRIQEMLHLLSENYPEKKSALHHHNPLEMLVATILSAQCTDARVNIVTKELFKKYKTAKDYADANLKKLEQEIRSTGFYHNKAKNIKNAGTMIIQEFHGKIPETMEELMKLPGVARKTANIVLSNAFGKIEGIAVDTHVRRISYRLGLTKHTDPNKIEKDLMAKIPRKEWWYVNHVLVDHGRAICKAPTPLCSSCFLQNLCPKNGVTKSK